MISASGSVVTVTGTCPEPVEDDGDGSPVSPYRRRQLNTWFALTSYCRATIETDAPGRTVTATISRFSAVGQRMFRRSRFVSMIDFVDTTTSCATSVQRSESADWARFRYSLSFRNRSSPSRNVFTVDGIDILRAIGSEDQLRALRSMKPPTDAGSAWI